MTRKIIAVVVAILALGGLLTLSTSGGGGPAQAAPPTTTPTPITFTTIQDPQTGELTPGLDLINPGNYFTLPVVLSFGAHYNWTTQVKPYCPGSPAEPWVDVVIVPDNTVVPMPWESQINVEQRVRLLHAPYVTTLLDIPGDHNMRAHLWCTDRKGRVVYYGSTGLIQLVGS